MLSMVGGVVGSIVIVVSLEQKAKERTPIDVTFAGIIISLIAIPLNAVPVIVTRFGGKVISVRLLAP